MTDEHDASELRTLGLEPEDLDGHTIEELSDYLDAGREPADPSIDDSPGCRLALDALERLRGVTSAMLAADEAANAEVDDSWVDRILSGIALDARAGRRIPVDSGDARIDLGVTEGAVRGLVRAAEELFPGVLVGRCRLDGDVTEPGAPVRLDLEVSVPYGEPIPALAQQLRAEVGRRLAAHTELVVAGIDITIEDISRADEGESDAAE
ncbi:Asp23/Gls24 family envelope stress response protein [Streptomyces sp. AC495_CC817]|uniref:Asp23/Gls24 family envelope stress response protein n=1 Tax=Streptomyces sp. AC495_CC817 TaxID=2823900 RepID=UPI001C27C525|nr:Asp23/Gls24 family envelope stress response protein [Streptomyces sp. AC495_CC817]